MRDMGCVRYMGILLALFLVAGPAVAAETPGEAKAEAKVEMTPEQHYAKDEVLYNNQWVLITTLFKDYRRGRYELNVRREARRPCKGQTGRPAPRDGPDEERDPGNRAAGTHGTRQGQE